MPKAPSPNLLKKAFDFISRLAHSRAAGLLIVFILLGAVSLTVIVAQQQQQIRQRAVAPVTCIGVGSYSTESDCSSYCTVKVYDYKRCVSINSAWTCQNCKNPDGYTPSSTPIPAPTSTLIPIPTPRPTIKPTVTPVCIAFACAGDCLAYDSSCNKISADDCCGVQILTPTKTPTPIPPVSCGASGQACCSGNVCNPGLICQFGGCDPLPASTPTKTPIPTPTKIPIPTATRTPTPIRTPTPTPTLPPGAVPTSALIVVTIYGRHLDENGHTLTKNIGQSVSLSNGLADTTSLGVFNFSGIRSGTYTVSAKLIPGYTVYNSVCEGCYTHTTESYKQGNTVTLTLPSSTGRISTVAEIYFKYIPILTPTPTPTQKPITTITSSPTVSSCSLKNQGDANCDGKINILDFDIWRGEFLNELEGKTTKRDSNFNKDSAITIVDFNIWKTGFMNASLQH